MWSDAARRAGRRVLPPVAERTWAAVARLAGRALRASARPAPWTGGGGVRVLVVAPHPDDETIGAGGAICLHVAAGDDVTVAVVTDGAGSRAGGLDAAEMARRRRGEVEAAAAALGVRRLECLGLAEGGWAESEAADALRPLLAEVEVVYAPSCVDYHPEHVAVARVVAGLVGPGQLVRVYELGVPLTPVLVNCVADIGAVAERKARALAAFATQRESLEPVARLARYRARLYGAEAVEVFWELPGAAYARLIRAGDWRRRRTPFRGVHRHPFGDPLAALVGLRHRRALRGASAAGRV
ncbi:MAG: PIG-L deacetylase family protein [Gaiellaceae bacterium]